MRKMLPTIVLFAVPVAASAQETTTYTYDALGRLVESEAKRGSSANPAETVKTGIKYDKAGNRTEYTVSGSLNGGSDTGSGASVPTTKKFVVVPLNGFTIIPIS